MKLTKSKLQQIIKEEAEKELNELLPIGAGWSGSPENLASGFSQLANVPAHLYRKFKGIKRKVNAIAIAWPDYKPIVTRHALGGLAHKLGIKKSPLATGHAGVVLINNKGVGYYFDFGRYKKAKPGDGIVRGPSRISGRAKWDKNGDLKNKKQYLNSIKRAKYASDYGKYRMIAALLRDVNYKGAYNYASSRSGKHKEYNLFQSVTSGENCATFVAEVLAAGGGGGAATSMRKQILAFPASIVKTLVNEPDEELVTA